MKKLNVFFLSLVLLSGQQLKADVFGGDIVVLTQILANALQQLQQLQQILKTGSNNLDLIREINQGINDSLNMIRIIAPNADPGIYRDWDKLQTALNGIETIYGSIPHSKSEAIQQHTDRNVAEAITLNNSIYSYAQGIDELSESIKDYSPEFRVEFTHYIAI